MTLRGLYNIVDRIAHGSMAHRAVLPHAVCHTDMVILRQMMQASRSCCKSADSLRRDHYTPNAVSACPCKRQGHHCAGGCRTSSCRE